MLYPQIERFEEDYGIAFDWQKQRGRVVAPNGVIIQLMGLHSESAIGKIRGQRYPYVVFDECGHYPNQDVLKKAVEEGAEPATNDFWGCGGRGILMVGTPGPVPEGYFYEVCQGMHGASVHHATIHANPFFEGRVEAILEKVKAKKGWTNTTPSFRREYLAEWCLDVEALCYNGWNGKILPDFVRPLTGYTVMGLDLGENHPCAFVVVRVVDFVWEFDGKRYVTQHAHVLETYEEEGMDPEGIAAKALELTNRWNVANIVGDSAGGGGIILNGLRRQHALPVDPAFKAGFKRDRIWMANGMLQRGKIHVYESSKTLTDQLRSVIWNEKRDDHHEKTPDHSCDALHYALVEAFQGVHEEELPPEYGSDEWKKEEAERRKREALSRGRRR